MKFWNLERGEKSAELYIYGEIAGTQDWGDEITPQMMQEQLNALDGADLDIYINSGGGEVFAGQAIYSMLKRYSGKKTVHIDGIAASIASVIAMAGDKIIMPENAMMMIHKAWSVCIGNSDDMQKLANDLIKLDGVIAGVYAAKTGKEAEEIAEAMANETWFTAAEAVEYGIADEIEDGKAIAASISGDILSINGQSIDLREYKNPPKALAAEPEPEPEPINADNGEETQPVQDMLVSQRRRFNHMRLRILDS